MLEPLELGFGFCRLVVAAPADAPYPALPGGITARVATKYPRLAQAHFGGAGRPVDIIQVNGSVEVAPLLNLSHWIVDLVDTGNTLKANGLVERETVLQCGAVLVANRATQKLKLDAYLELMARLEAEFRRVSGPAVRSETAAPPPAPLNRELDRRPHARRVRRPGAPRCRAPSRDPARSAETAARA